MKKFLIQTGILLLIYYFAPGIISDFLSDINPQITRYTVMFLKIAVAVLIIYSLFNFRIGFEKSLIEIGKTNFKLKQSNEVINKMARYLVQFIYVIVIVILTVPLLKSFGVNTKLLTFVKLGVLAYIVYISWSMYKLFDQEVVSSKE